MLVHKRDRSGLIVCFKVTKILFIFHNIIARQTAQELGDLKSFGLVHIYMGPMGPAGPVGNVWGEGPVPCNRMRVERASYTV